MAFEVVNGDGRGTQGRGKSFREGGANQQCTCEPRALCVGNGMNGFERSSAVCEYAPQKRDGAPDVVARGELGNDATVFLMHGDLRVQAVGYETSVRVVECNAGFVAGRFNAENEHGRDFNRAVLRRT